MFKRIPGLLALLWVAACGQSGNETAVTPAERPCVPTEREAESLIVATGLTADITVSGCGREAEAGDYAEVHYTGWLYDPEAENSRGEQFDSSVDRGQTFIFPLGAGRVIPGWDRGVVGMQTGEKRTLTISPELAYKDTDRTDRDGNVVIPANSTLVFDIELIGLEGPADEQSTGE